MSGYIGDFAPGAMVRDMWNSNDINGASITRSTNGTISVYKDGDTTQSTAGITDTEDFDSLTGVHLVEINTSADAFYSSGSDYVVVLSGATIDTQTVNAVLFSFSLYNRAVANVAPGAIDSDSIAAGAIGASALADNAITAAKIADGAIDAGTFASGAIDASAIATNAIGSNEVSAAAVSKIVSGIATQASLDIVAGYIDTEVAAIKAKTDLIPGTTDGKTFAELVTLMAAVLLGKASGLATTTAVYRAVDDSKARVSATVDSDGNRSAVTLDAA
jgi:hypothetical protein